MKCLLVASVGCGGQSNRTPDGTGGSSACLPAVVQSPPHVGFQQAWIPGTYVVVSSLSDTVEFASGPDVLEFRWVGPDLSSVFGLGESVTVGAESKWIVVSTPVKVAAVLSADSSQPISLPFSGPSFSYLAECSAPTSDGDCRVGHAIEFGDFTISHGKTADIGGWQITNSFSVASGPCDEPATQFTTVVTALHVQ